MINPKSLSKTERNFFRLVAEAAFSNPFSPKRRELDEQMIGTVPGESRKERVMRLVGKIEGMMKKLEEEERADFRKYRIEDQSFMRIVFLFHVYHRYTKQLDDLIARQLELGPKPALATFSRDAITEITHAGFSQGAAVRYLAIFYQIRRAYFFIDQNLVGKSPCMTELRARLWNNVFTHDISLYERHLWNHMEDFSTLLLGETGTGKGAAAAAIGRSCFIPFDESKRSFEQSFTEAFISINLSQFTESLIESELFGHRKGAFSGAIDHHTGVFARCAPQGSIFLDEIGDVSPQIQIKLLQVLQSRAFSPVGSHEDVRFHGRVIGATNKPLDDLRREGTFRDDFYYRLCSDVITVPTLRQRIQEDPRELEDLVEHIVARIVSNDAKDLATFVLESLAKTPGKDYGWPGNVRELEQAIRRVMVTHAYHGDRVTAGEDPESQLIAGVREGTLDANALLSAYCRLLYQRCGTYEEVARRAGLDRRTAKKYITEQDPT